MFESTFPLNVNQNTGRETKVIELMQILGFSYRGHKFRIGRAGVGWLIDKSAEMS